LWIFGFARQTIALHDFVVCTCWSCVYYDDRRDHHYHHSCHHDAYWRYDHAHNHGYSGPSRLHCRQAAMGGGFDCDLR
jgi:hypothetical protein